MHILGLPTDIFNVYPASVKFKTYQARWQIGDIYVSGDARKTEDNPQGLGCYLVMTGRGCDDIFRILDSRNYTFGDMFKHCERRYGLDNFHFTRLDIAIDDNPLPHITPHTLRHTFCTRLASKNMNPKDLQYIMGHSNISITMNWYAHASIDTAKSEVQRLIA